MKIFELSNEQDTLALAATFAKKVQAPMFITLKGTLGAGKTTFSRGFLQGLGYKGAVKSPTYTIVEIYEVNSVKVNHFDLYRIVDLEELELMGIRDYFQDNAIILLEWPEYAQGLLPPADIECSIQLQNTQRTLQVQGHTPKGKAFLNTL